MTLRRLLRYFLEAAAIPAGLAAAIGLTDALRALPGPRIALALALRETGHRDGASFLVVAGASAVVFGLVALALGSAGRHPLRAALLRSTAVLGAALALQAVSLQFLRQATFGFDWSGSLHSAAPFVSAMGALLGSWGAGLAYSSDRLVRHGLKERPVEGRADPVSVVKIGA